MANFQNGMNMDIPANRAYAKKMGLDVRTNIDKETEAGAAFGKKMVEPGSLGRLGENADLRTAITGAREMAGGLTGPEMQAQRDQASQNINTNTEQARRRLAAAQARSGVRGATAGAQQASILGQGVQAQQGLERDLLLGNREAKSAGISQLANIAGEVGQFDLSQAAREKFVPLSTGLAFAGLGATERGSIRASNAAAASSRGGGGTYLCTKLYNEGEASKEELLEMHSLLSQGLLICPRAIYMYITSFKDIISDIKWTREEAKSWKKKLVNDVLSTWKSDGVKEACFLYTKRATEIAKEYGVKAPKNLYSTDIFTNVFYLAKLATNRTFLSLTVNYTIEKLKNSFKELTLKEA